MLPTKLTELLKRWKASPLLLLLKKVLGRTIHVIWPPTQNDIASASLQFTLLATSPMVPKNMNGRSQGNQSKESKAESLKGVVSESNIRLKIRGGFYTVRGISERPPPMSIFLPPSS